METIPGLGIKDFVNDVGHLVQNRSGRSRRARRRVTRKRSSPKSEGLYHQPGTASIMSSRYDYDIGIGGESSGFSADFDSSGELALDSNEFSADDYVVSDEDPHIQVRNHVSSYGKNNNEESPSPNGRQRIMSDGTGTKGDDELDSDPELL
jgi:hypothetical protein